jgi:hypothetical protein
VGTPARDAAVDPHPEDYLVPVNAGKADPHGPLVVAPEIHNSSRGPHVPGAVTEAKEKEAAERALVDGDPSMRSRRRSPVTTPARWTCPTRRVGTSPTPASLRSRVTPGSATPKKSTAPKK